MPRGSRSKDTRKGETCTSRILREIAFVKIISRKELTELCRGSSIPRVVLHYLSKLRLVYITRSGYVVLIPWLIYLKELHNGKWVEVFRRILMERKIVMSVTEFEDIVYVVEKHPIRSLHDFVKIYVRFQDYVDELARIPSKSIPKYCTQPNFAGKDPKEIYLYCIAPLLTYSSWVLELLSELIRDIAMHPNPREALRSFFDVFREELGDEYSETIDKLRKAVQFLTNIKLGGEDLIEKVVREYSEKMKISYDERSYIRNLLRFMALSKL